MNTAVSDAVERTLVLTTEVTGAVSVLVLEGVVEDITQAKIPMVTFKKNR